MTAVSIGQAAARTRWRSRWLRWLVAIAALGPIWLVPRDVWDGVIGAYGIARHDFSGIYHWLIPSNWGLVYLMLRGIELLEAASALPAWVWVKVLLCASVIGLAREARLLCIRVLNWDERDARFAELAALSFPCWYILYGSTFLYLVFIWCVFAGHRLLHEGGPVRRAAGFLLVLLSFQVNSNFVMVFALEGMRWLYRERAGKWAWGRSALVLGSAVAVYLSLRLIWTPSGPYQGYNDLVWPFSIAGAVSWIRAAAMAATWVPLLVFPAAVAWLASPGPGRPVPPTAAGLARREAAALALLMAGALFAYLAVGKGAPLFILQLPQGWLGTGTHLGKAAAGWIYTTADGWSMRNAFLLSVPAGIALAWLVRGVLARSSRVEGAWRAALLAMLLVNFALLAQGHATKLARFSQEQSLVRGLQQQPPPPGGTVDLQLAQPVGWSAWTYEANYLFWLAYGRAEWAVALFGPDDLSRRAALQDRRDALESALPKSHYLMDGLPVRRCHTSYLIHWPAALEPAAVVYERLGWRAVPPARVIARESQCAQP